MTADHIVMQSYGRCCASPGFFDDFYARFLRSSAEVRDKFTNTDMPAQKTLLRQGILNLVLYARGMPDTKLKALARSHSREKLDIAPHLYDLWIGALLDTIALHDREHTPDTRTAWQQVLAQGVSVIQAGYQQPA